jgi:transcription initiation factor TFIID subunit TAF12
VRPVSWFKAAAGAVTGALIGSMIDREQQRQLQQQSSQTLQTIQHNDAVYQQQQKAAQAPAQGQALPGGQPPSTPPADASSQMQPLTVDDIKALSSAGVKPEAITKEIDISHSKFSPQDIAAAQQATPAVDPGVIEYMKNRQS